MKKKVSDNAMVAQGQNNVKPNSYKISICKATFQDKVSNYMTWKFRACDIQIQAKRIVTMDLILFFLIMMGRWMKHKNVNERWDTQSQSQSQDTSHKYLQWNNELKHDKTGHDKKLFGYLKFKFKTCLELNLFR